LGWNSWNAFGCDINESKILSVANQLLRLGLKVGIYGSAGTETGGGYPTQIGHEYLDAATFSAWGVDYFK